MRNSKAQFCILIISPSRKMLTALLLDTITANEHEKHSLERAEYAVTG